MHKDEFPLPSFAFHWPDLTTFESRILLSQNVPDRNFFKFLKTKPGKVQKFQACMAEWEGHVCGGKHESLQHSCGTVLLGQLKGMAQLYWATVPSFSNKRLVRTNFWGVDIVPKHRKHLHFIAWFFPWYPSESPRELRLTARNCPGWYYWMEPRLLVFYPEA